MKSPDPPRRGNWVPLAPDRVAKLPNSITSLLDRILKISNWIFPLSAAFSKNVTFISHHGGNYLLILISPKVRDGTFMSLPAAKQIYIYQRKLGFLLVSHCHDGNVYYRTVLLALVLKLCDDTFVAWRAVVAMYGARSILLVCSPFYFFSK